MCSYMYLLQLLGDAEASVDPFPALCVFGLIVLQEVASGEFSGYESEQGKIYSSKQRADTKHKHRVFPETR